MSINVTVSGNPVRINRGRMVTNDPNLEIQKRRRMRLEQVRSQSKEIAENIRNKVRKDKTRQISQFEKDSSSKLKEWQNKKLLQLQDQYVESVKEIGKGHSEALVQEADEREFLEERSKIINTTAKDRGAQAYEKQQIEKNEASLKVAVPKQTKKMVRDVENARAAMVSKMGKKSVNVLVHSHTENDVTDFIVDISSPSLSPSSSSGRSRSPIRTPKRSSVGVSKSTSPNKRSGILVRDLSPKASTSDSFTQQILAEPAVDTRISDRIKHRQMESSNNCVSAIIKQPYFVDTSKERVSNKENIRSPEVSTTKIRKAEGVCTCNCQLHRNIPVVESCKCATTCLPDEIPSKPTISIRASSGHSNDKREFNRVKHYDHDNRFSQDLIMDNSNVHRISAKSIETLPSDRSELRVEDVQSRREQEAAERGKRAIEKERIQKDMSNLMKKLPVLQKQERIASLDPAKDKFHMSSARLKELEENRQRKIESAFEKLVPNTITISPKNKKSGTTPVTSKSVQQQSPSTINVGEWKNTDDEEKANEELKTLLEKLKHQKDMLLQETDVLPSNSNLLKLLTKLDAKVGSKHRIVSSSSSSSDSPKRKRYKSKEKSDKKVQSDSPRRKHKRRTHKNVLVLQNMSTQTSPKVYTARKSPVRRKVVQKVVDPAEADKVCEILIKIQDNNKPEILVSSPKKAVSGVQIDIEGPDGDNLQKERDVAKVTILDPNKSLKNKKEVDLKIRKTADASNLWKENLAKDTNSSTSYYSPPDFSRQSNLMQKPPKQSNISMTRPNKSIDPKLLIYIKKLLQMSKSGVDELGVSTVSDVSTPSSSVVNVSTNNPAQKLMTLLKMFDLNLEDVAHNISVSGNDSKHVGGGTNVGRSSNNIQANNVSHASRSVVTGNASRMRSPGRSSGVRSNGSRLQSSNRITVEDVSRNNFSSSHHDSRINDPRMSTYIPNNIINDTRDSGGISGYDASQNQTANSTVSNRLTHSNNSGDARNVTLEEYTIANYPNVIADKYSKLADMCQQRIQNLAEMIQQVRSEKQQILSPGNTSSGSDRANHTSYMALPVLDISPQSEAMQRELTKQLTTVDFNKIPGDVVNDIADVLSRESDMPVDTDTIERYLKLISSPTDDPVFLDIPKLPKLQSQQVEQQNGNKRPPPMLRKYNDKVQITPHELSTIPEGDSLRQRSKSPEARNNSGRSEARNYSGPASRDTSPTRKLADELIVASRSISPNKLKSPRRDDRVNRSLQIGGQHPSQHANQQTNFHQMQGSVYQSQGSTQKPQSVHDSQASVHQQPQASVQQGGHQQKQSSLHQSQPGRHQSPPVSHATHTSPRVTHQPPPVTHQSTNQPQSSSYSNSQPGPSNPQTYSPKQLQQIIQKLQDISTDTSTDKSEVDVEAMLINMGMGWAVSTLRKTQQALARQSSSSSVNMTNAGESSNEKNVTTSTSKSQNSISFMKDFQDISAIHGSGKHRTSTPLHRSSGSTELSFSNLSDAASVRKTRKEDSGNIKFMSIPNETAMDDDSDG